MKRFFVTLLILTILLGLCACTAEPQTDTQPTEPACPHNWVDATCATAKTCSLCGQKEGYGMGHSWVKGVCTVCDAVDLGFDPLVDGTWLYLTKERWKILDFQPDGTCDIRTIIGAPVAARTLEECVNTAVANLQRQYKDNWEHYAADKYYILKIKDYYYVANMTSVMSDYTFDGKNASIMQNFIPFYVELMSNSVLQEVESGNKYINMEVIFVSDLWTQYKMMKES